MLVVEFGEIQAGFVEKINVFLGNAKHFHTLILRLIFESFHTCLGLDECLHLMGCAEAMDEQNNDNC